MSRAKESLVTSQAIWQDNVAGERFAVTPLAMASGCRGRKIARDISDHKANGCRKRKIARGISSHGKRMSPAKSRSWHLRSYNIARDQPERAVSKDVAKKPTCRFSCPGDAETIIKRSVSALWAAGRQRASPRKNTVI